MSFILKMSGVIVGRSELENRDATHRRATGVFRPGLGYDLVQPVFRLYSKAVGPDGAQQDAAMLQRYYKARDALNLELTDASGGRIPTSTIHIADYTIEDGPSAIQLDVLIPDESYWARR